MTDKKLSLSRAFSRLPIRHKLTVIILGITFAALMTAMIAGGAGQYLSMRAEKQDQLGIMADFTAKNVASSLDFLDQKSAQESLNALAFDPSISRACVYDAEGALFASYKAENAKSSVRACPSRYEEVRKDGGVNEIRSRMPVRMGRNTIGAVTLIYDMTGAHIRFFWLTMMSLVVMLVALSIAYILANIFQRVISRPVTELANAAHKFAGREDFSVRVRKTTEDELGHMVDSFNRMVEKMKARDEIIVRAREDAISANRMKSEFLANMSHELRTPLNSIIGMTRILMESEGISQDNRDMAGTVYKSSTNLLDIVNDILDISKIEAGSIVLEKIGFDLKESVASLAEVMAPLASRKGISLAYNFKSENIPFLVGDPLRIGRILTNLVSNAVKYTDKGAVNITIAMNDGRKKPAAPDVERRRRPRTGATLRTLADNQVEIYCAVSDTGIGIPADKLDIIFEKFSQADASTTRKYGGTGLGLAITRELVQMMGGEIGVASEIGKGSVFWFRIPFDVTDKLDEDLQSKRRGKGRRLKNKENARLMAARDARLLLAEDHLLNQDFMKKLLPRMGFRKFDIVESGTGAVEACKNKDYDLVLMDCHMPEKNGYEATKDIRKHEEKTGRHVLILAMTADAMKGTQEKCLQAGMDDYISKPVDSDELKDILEQWFAFDEVRGEAGPKKPPPPAAASAASVDLSSLKEHANFEEIVGFITVFCEQSQQSLDLLAQHCAEGKCREWVESAHKLKGGAGMLGAKKLHTLCAEAQQMDDATSAARREMLDRILKEYADVKDYLDKAVARQVDIGLA